MWGGRGGGGGGMGGSNLLRVLPSGTGREEASMPNYFILYPSHSADIN